MESNIEESNYEMNYDNLVNLLERRILDMGLSVRHMNAAQEILIQKLKKIDLRSEILSLDKIREIIDGDGGVLDEYFQRENVRRGTSVWFVGDKEVRSREELLRALKPFFPWGLYSIPEE